jgi:dihydrofolate reductase
MLISLIAAMTPDYIIGDNGNLPWYIPEDLKHFKKLTSGNTILMGRKTFNSIGKALPNRKNIILSRNIPPFIPNDTQWFTSVEDAIAYSKKSGTVELFIIGGSEIYSLFMPIADRMYISVINLTEKITGDTFFPKWNNSEWKIECSEIVNNIEFKIYNRIK